MVGLFIAVHLTPNKHPGRIRDRPNPVTKNPVRQFFRIHRSGSYGRKTDSPVTAEQRIGFPAVRGRFRTYPRWLHLSIIMVFDRHVNQTGFVQCFIQYVVQ